MSFMNKYFYGNSEPTWTIPPMREFFYGNLEPTCITRSEKDLPYGSTDAAYYCPMNRYVVNVVEFRVPQCCATKCEQKIKKRLYNIPDVDNVIVDFHNQKVTVTGNARQDKILKELKKVKKKARSYFPKQDGQL